MVTQGVRFVQPSKTTSLGIPAAVDKPAQLPSGRTEPHIFPCPTNTAGLARLKGQKRKSSNRSQVVITESTPAQPTVSSNAPESAYPLTTPKSTSPLAAAQSTCSITVPQLTHPLAVSQLTCPHTAPQSTYPLISPQSTYSIATSQLPCPVIAPPFQCCSFHFSKHLPYSCSAVHSCWACSTIRYFCQDHTYCASADDNSQH